MRFDVMIITIVVIALLSAIIWGIMKFLARAGIVFIPFVCGILAAVIYPDPQKDWSGRWGEYQFPKKATGYNGGPALVMQPIRHTKRINTSHPTLTLRMQKNGHATSKKG